MRSSVLDIIETLELLGEVLIGDLGSGDRVRSMRNLIRMDSCNCLRVTRMRRCATCTAIHIVARSVTERVLRGGDGGCLRATRRGRRSNSGAADFDLGIVDDEVVDDVVCNYVRHDLLLLFAPSCGLVRLTGSLRRGLL